MAVQEATRTRPVPFGDSASGTLRTARSGLRNVVFWPVSERRNEGTNHYFLHGARHLFQLKSYLYFRPRAPGKLSKRKEAQINRPRELRCYATVMKIRSEINPTRSLLFLPNEYIYIYISHTGKTSFFDDLCSYWKFNVKVRSCEMTDHGLYGCLQCYLSVVCT